MNMIKNNNANMNTESAWTETKNKSDKKPHPCQYCGKNCFGLQCKECHLKMIAERNSECLDCDLSFLSLRKDGSRRKRCGDCQVTYTVRYYKNCPDCSKSFRFTLDNGKTFAKCGDCYKTYSKKREEARQEETKDMNDCKKCEIKTYYDLCRNCFYEEKNVTDTYMLSKCFGCGNRYKGNFKYCGDCKK